MTSTNCPALVPANTPQPYAWQIVRYQQARWALSARCLSKNPHLAWEALGYSDVQPSGNGVPPSYILNLANSDPPDHTRLRRLLAKAFTPLRIRALQPRIVEAAGALVDRMARMAPAGNVDLIRSFIFPLQVIVTCDLLGVPPHHRDSFRSLAAGMQSPASSAGRPQRYHEAYRRMGTLLAEVLAAKQEQIDLTCSPDQQPDLLSALISARDGSDGLTVHEMQSMAMLLISAGQEPTIDLIANGMLALLLNPVQLHLFHRHPELRLQAVEELLRHGAPVLAAPRIAAEDITIDGTVVRRGDVIAVMLDCAHRDPSQFHEPDALDITRKPNAHLAFGHGIHYCIGAPLARLQACAALTVLVNRFPHISLAHSPDRLSWRPTEGSRGLVELPVILGSSEIDSPRGYIH